MLDLIHVLQEEKLKRRLLKVLHENDRFRFALMILVSNFAGFCCLCDLDPEKTGKECPVKIERNPVKCTAWLVDGANKQKEAWYRDIAHNL